MFFVSGDKTMIQSARMLELLNQTYWAKDRTPAQMELAIENSVCYGAYHQEDGR